MPVMNCWVFTRSGCAVTPRAATTARARRLTTWSARRARSSIRIDAIKLKVGKLSAAEDAARVGAVRRAYGDNVDILLDANGGWRSSTEAVSAMRRLEEFHPYWIEERFAPTTSRPCAASPRRWTRRWRR